MAKWIKFHLNLGKTESGHQLISKKLVLDMHRATTPLPLGPTAISRPNYPVSHLYTGYGYGWGVGEYRGIAFLRKIPNVLHANNKGTDQSVYSQSQSSAFLFTVWNLITSNFNVNIHIFNILANPYS